MMKINPPKELSIFWQTHMKRMITMNSKDLLEQLNRPLRGKTKFSKRISKRASLTLKCFTSLLKDFLKLQILILLLKEESVM